MLVKHLLVLTSATVIALFFALAGVLLDILTTATLLNETILKKMKWHQQGIEKLSVWKELAGDIPLVAIGGMSTERAGGAFDAGADVVSAVTDITLHDDPEGRVKAWLEVCG